MAGLKDYFSFSKRERAGALVLIILIVIIYLLPAFFSYPKRSLDPKSIAEIKEQMADLKRIDSGAAENIAGINKNEKYHSDHESSNRDRKTVLFPFDPNTLSQQGWRKLGLTDRTIRTIGNYISKGGRFRNPEDIGKIFGLRKEQYDQLLPFVRIKINDEINKKENLYLSPQNKPGRNYSPAIIDINAADTSMLISLPGIGSKLATRILHFRNKLGGFYSIDQVKETFGLPDSTFQKIKPFLQCDNSRINQININTSDAESLKNHPYIRWNIANAIINYRKQHGDYTSIGELLKIDIIAPETLQKLTPYLKVN